MTESPQGKFNCYIVFANGKKFYFVNDPNKNDAYIYGGFHWNRNLNKTPIYVQLPVKTEDDGGYGYDLGFVTDKITIDYYTSDWSKYIYYVTQIKENSDEYAGKLYMGYDNDIREYEVLVNYFNSYGDSATELIHFNTAFLITSKTY